MGCLYGLYRLFWVSRRRAAIVAVLCVIGGFLMAIAGWPMIAGGLFMYAAIYGGIWFYKYNRDTKFNGQVQAIQQQPPAEPPVTKVSPESSHLFVPRSHQDM